MILTIYHPDGKMERHPVGYGGGMCHQATAPYEANDIAGQVKTKPTPEAYQEPADTQDVAEQQKLRG